MLDNTPLPRSETAESRSSQRSDGRARTGSDPTTIGGKSTPASEFDLLQQPPGQLDMLSPIAEALSAWLVSSSNKPLTDLREFSALLVVDMHPLTQVVTHRP